MTLVTIDSAEQWADAIAAQIVPLGVHRVADDFRATIDRRDLREDLRLTRVVNGETTIQRTASDISSTDDGFAIFHLNYHGSGRVTQGDLSRTLDGLSATLYTTDRPASFSFSTGNDGVLIQMPRELLPLGTSELRHALARPEVVRDPLLRVLRSFVETTRDELPNLDRAGRAVVAGTLMDLLAALLRPGSPGADPGALLVRMQDFIDRHFDDPDLDVPTLAGRFNVSTRLVYSTFASIGSSPADHIRSVRVTRAAKLLVHTDLTVVAISAGCGFGDVSTFVRAFRRAYDCSPSEWRQGNAGRRRA